MSKPEEARFRTIGGTEVVATFPTHYPSVSRWECTGCGADGYGNDPKVRGDANTHAGVCRAMPRT